MRSSFGFVLGVGLLGVLGACGGGGDDAGKAKLASDLVTCKEEVSSLKEQLAVEKAKLAKALAANPAIELDAITLNGGSKGGATGGGSDPVSQKEGHVKSDLVIKIFKQNVGGLNACYVSALKRTLPKVTRPLQELRIVSDGQRVVVHTQDGAFEPLTGQMVLDFEVKSLRDDVVRVLRPSAGRERARTAYELYLRASQLDEDPATMDEAERLYGEAIALDPWLAIAYTNLGNIRFRRHDAEGAEALYKRGLEIDPRQPEAQYNLGYVMLERGEPEASIPLFHGAIEADPKFSDAYFNLAMAYEQIGETQKARPFWKNYISLEPSGTWTEIARRHL